MTKILAIISTHGNELLGPNLLAYMLAKRSKLLENMDRSELFIRWWGRKNTVGLKNFVYNDTLQTIPAFLGEEAYKHDGTYAGFIG